MEDTKTVNFHVVLESRKSSTFLEQCFQTFVYDIARECETTIMSRIYTLCDSENLVSLNNSDVAHRTHMAVKRPSIREITSDDASSSRAMPLEAAGRIQMRSDKTFTRNTWNVHLILVRDIHSFDQISQADTTEFEWNPQDRFIVLIARFPEEGAIDSFDSPSNESNSRINDVLKTLWSKRKVQKIFVSETILVKDTVRINRIVRTYNPFAKVNDSGL